MGPKAGRPVYLSESRHGRGTFAGRPFLPGDAILNFTGKILTSEQAKDPRFEHYCLQIGIDRQLYVDPPARYVNHSCDPNAGLKDAVTLAAIRAIAAGEQICFDYSTSMLEDGWTLACACQSPLCRGLIGDFSRLDAGTRSRYLALKIVPPWLIAEMA
ncbi:MAG: SET domain-containing protein-lysine N-methyltransferase [Elusimicrobia bacterium]|nr:SET domain-containing protein-lysine N-methyltransferase [Elusimicrobiota bacterium]